MTHGRSESGPPFLHPQQETVQNSEWRGLPSLSGPFLMYSQQEPTSAVATTAQSSIRGPAKSPPITIDGSRAATLQCAGWYSRNDLPWSTGLRPTSESILGISQDPLTAPSHRGSHQYGPTGGLVRGTAPGQNTGFPFRQASSPGRLGSPTVSEGFLDSFIAYPGPGRRKAPFQATQFIR